MSNRTPKHAPKPNPGALARACAQWSERTREMLGASGITPALLRLVGVNYPPFLERLANPGAFGEVPPAGFFIDYHDPAMPGRVRLHSPLADGGKYWQPPGTPPVLYLPPVRAIDWHEVAADPSRPLYVVEGEKKAFVLCCLGLPCIGIGGVWCAQKDGALLPQWQPFALVGRRVSLVFDADRIDKRDVRDAEARTALLLGERGASVDRVDLPPERGKGVDDFLVAAGFGPSTGQLEQAKAAFLDLPHVAIPPPAPPCSDGENVRRLLDHHHAGLLYVVRDKDKRWFARMAGGWWHPNEEAAQRAAQHVPEYVARELREAQRHAPPEHEKAAAKAHAATLAALGKWRAQSAMGAHVAAALTQARPYLRCDARELDADPYLLGCRNGVLDLRTCVLRPYRPSDRVSLVTACDYQPDAVCKAWEQFLQDAFRDDAQTVAYVRWLLGSTLCGLHPAEVVVICYGGGGNGKGTLLEPFAAALGDYATPAPGGLLMVTRNERHPAELAALQGKRMVTSADVGELRHLDDEKLKTLSGSDRIAARGMFENFAPQPPTWQLYMQGNKLPHVSDTSRGMWRRLRVLPFDVDFAVSDLKQRLMAPESLPGILACAVRGWRSYHAAGEQVPPAVRLATAAYQRSANPLGEFFVERIVLDPAARPDFDMIYDAYCEHANKRRKPLLSRRTFSDELTKLGLPTGKRGHNVATCPGLRLCMHDEGPNGELALSGERPAGGPRAGAAKVTKMDAYKRQRRTKVN